MSARNEAIIERVRAGETYGEIGRSYGISAQRVEQIARGTPRPCRTCGDDLRPRRGPHCLPCSTCSSCGRHLATSRGRGLLCGRCKPKKGAVGPETMRSVETGIYVHFFPQTGYALPGFFVDEYNPFRRHRFDSIEEARTFRVARRERYRRECAECGKTCTPQPPHGRYCSEECKRAHRKAVRRDGRRAP